MRVPKSMSSAPVNQERGFPRSAFSRSTPAEDFFVCDIQDPSKTKSHQDSQETA